MLNICSLIQKSAPTTNTRASPIRPVIVLTCRRRWTNRTASRWAWSVTGHPSPDGDPPTPRIELGPVPRALLPDHLVGDPAEERVPSVRRPAGREIEMDQGEGIAAGELPPAGDRPVLEVAGDTPRATLLGDRDASRVAAWHGRIMRAAARAGNPTPGRRVLPVIPSEALSEAKGEAKESRRSARGGAGRGRPAGSPPSRAAQAQGDSALRHSERSPERSEGRSEGIRWLHTREQ